jgi:tetratricopeptide (TPR) repeat protein
MPTSFKQHYESVLSEKQAAERLAYTGFERHYCLDIIYQTMLGRPPFINQLYHEATIAKFVQQLQDLSEQNKSADLNDTMSLLEAAIQESPDDWRLHWQYALIAGDGFKDTRIEEIQLRKVIQLCPYDPAYLALGKNLRQQGRTQEAKQILYQLLEIKPNSGQAHFELASIALMQKDNKAAIKHLTQEIRIEPTASIQPYGFLADTYEKSGNPKKAIQTLYNAIEIFPEKQTPQAHSYLGYLLYNQGKYKKALKEMETALKINPDCANQEVFQKYYKLLKAKLDN